MKSTISSKGQVTVPVAVREKLGLTPGSVIDFEVREGGAFLRKGYRGDHPVDAVYGRIELDRPVDEILDEMRGPRPVIARPVRKRRRQRSK
jgi:AbrB family looped-hinge helix DNA binding protein